jgi:preprotein translocase subunit YajC
MTYFYTCHFYFVLFFNFYLVLFLHVFSLFCLQHFKKKQRRQGQQLMPLQSGETCTAGG